jgi:Flp pilus assembly protein TadD
MSKPLILSGVMFAAALAITSAFSVTHAAMTPSGEMVTVAEFVEAEKIVKSGNFDGAIELLKETIRQRPDHANAWNLLGFVHRRLGKFDLAEEYYDAALTLNPNHTGALNYMGQLFIQTGRPDKAKALLVRLKEACSAGCEDLDFLQTAVETGIAGNY